MTETFKASSSAALAQSSKDPVKGVHQPSVQNKGHELDGKLPYVLHIDQIHPIYPFMFLVG